MRNRSLPVTLAAVITAALSVPAFLAAQASSGAKMTGSAPAATKTAASKATAAKPADAKPWKQIYLPNGQPDLQGIWTNISFTPMERPEKYANREFLSKQEEDADYKAGVQHSYEYTYGNTADSPFYDSTAYGLDAWQQGVQPNPRSSLIVDPPDGHFPPLTAAAAAARKPRGGGGGSNVPRADTAQDQSSGVRCMVFGGPPMLPSVTNSDMRIIQGDNAIFVEWEWDSSPRVIKLNDTDPPLSKGMHLWRGDSRGHWEGDTLVAVTTNLRPGFVYGNANADTTKVTEYFKRIGPTTIEYKFTIDDPSTWTKPWTAIVPFSHVNGPMQEYACEEGNFSMVEILQAGREADKEKAEATSGNKK